MGEKLQLTTDVYTGIILCLEKCKDIPKGLSEACESKVQKFMTKR